MGESANAQRALSAKFTKQGGLPRVDGPVRDAGSITIALQQLLGFRKSFWMPD
jgi:hypothetical protein